MTAAAALYAALLLPWVWWGGQRPLAAPTLCAAIALALFRTPLAALGLVAALALLGIERRFPTHCRICRFFRAAIAASTALALAVLHDPGLFG